MTLLGIQISVEGFCCLLPQHNTVTILWIKQLPSRETAMDLDHACGMKTSYNCLATRPQMEGNKGRKRLHCTKTFCVCVKEILLFQILHSFKIQWQTVGITCHPKNYISDNCYFQSFLMYFDFLRKESRFMRWPFYLCACVVSLSPPPPFNFWATWLIFTWYGYYATAGHPIVIFLNSYNR